VVAEVYGCGVDGEMMDRRPEVELASGRMALEAAVAVSFQIGPELTASGMPAAMDRARTTQPSAVAATGHIAYEQQDLLDRDL
jgi:hypothetical protein